MIMHIYTKCAKKLKKVLTNEIRCDIILKLSHERTTLSVRSKKVEKTFKKVLTNRVDCDIMYKSLVESVR